jgi:threonine/homoserine/homoserine lactone efflux protein
MASGRLAGWYAAIGFHLAGFGHIAAATFGVTILLQMIPALFVIMKAVGAAYLIWLGVFDRPGAIGRAKWPCLGRRSRERSEGQYCR